MALGVGRVSCAEGPGYSNPSHHLGGKVTGLKGLLGRRAWVPQPVQAHSLGDARPGGEAKGLLEEAGRRVGVDICWLQAVLWASEGCAPM